MTDAVDNRSRKPLAKRASAFFEPYLYSAPALFLIVAVILVPLIVGISYAFRDIQLLNPFSGGFIGLDHFRALAEDKAFRRALGNTLWWTGASVFLQFVFGLILALLLDKPFRGRGTGAGVGLPAMGGSGPFWPASTGPGFSTRSSARCRTGFTRSA